MPTSLPPTTFTHHLTDWIAQRLDSSPEALSEAAKDFGNIVHYQPRAVFTPTSATELVEVVRYANANQLTVAPSGRRHSLFGQAQAADGIVVSLRNLNQIYEIGQDAVWVDAGVTWSDLLEATLQKGLTPPIFTDYIHLSVGGTLSVGGVGAQSFRVGAQVDNVLALEVVTGTGEVMHCSPNENRDLFDAVRAGLGQFGIISKAQIRLVKAPTMARYFRLLARDLDVVLTDLKQMIDTGPFECVQGFAVPNDLTGIQQFAGDAFNATPLPSVEDAGGWLFVIEGVKYFEPGEMLDNKALLANITYLEQGIWFMDLPYAAYVARLDMLEQALTQVGLWQTPHAWIDLFLPFEAATGYIGDELAALSPADVAGPVLIYPYKRDKFTTPLFMLPKDDYLVLFAVLRTAIPPTRERAQGLLAANAELYQRCVAIGGSGYAIDAVPLEPAAWQAHFGAQWEAVVAAKEKFDPNHLHAPGQRVFV